MACDDRKRRLIDTACLAISEADMRHFRESAQVFRLELSDILPHKLDAFLESFVWIVHRLYASLSRIELLSWRNLTSEAIIRPPSELRTSPP